MDDLFVTDVYGAVGAEIERKELGRGGSSTRIIVWQGSINDHTERTRAGLHRLHYELYYKHPDGQDRPSTLRAARNIRNHDILPHQDDERLRYEDHT